MIRKIFLLVVLLVLTAVCCFSQAFINTGDLFKRQNAGNLGIIQDQAIDSIISRYIVSSRKVKTSEGTHGMQGFRIQIYSSPNRNAVTESAKAYAEFINIFPDIDAYTEFMKPGWYMVRVGNYRSKTECYKDLMLIEKEFPDAYPVPTVIIFPDQIK
jgi:hypothetical protein